MHVFSLLYRAQTREGKNQEKEKKKKRKRNKNSVVSLFLFNFLKNYPIPSAHLLRCLAALGPALHPGVAPMWDSALPRLVEYLEDKSKFALETWEDLVLRLLSETIRLVNDPMWVRNLGVQYTEQLSVYDGEPEMKRLCMKHLGLVLQKTDEKRFIRESLATLFEKTNFKDSLEREGCAQAYGYSSTTHLDITVDILTGRINEVPAEPEKKGLFGGLFDSGPKVDQVTVAKASF